MSEETALPEVFDPATQEGTSFDVIPIAIYVAQVIEACVVAAQTEKGHSHYIKLTWQVTEGPYEGRLVWQRITFLHSNAQATTIGRKQFKDLCIATGISEQVADVEVFKFIPCEIKVGVEKDKQGVYPDQNKVSHVWSLGQAPKAKAPAEPKKPASGPTSAAATPAAAATAKPAVATGNGNTPPWRDKPKPAPTLGEEMNDEIPHR